MWLIGEYADSVFKGLGDLDIFEQFLRLVDLCPGSSTSKERRRNHLQGLYPGILEFTNLSENSALPEPG
ncbi:MAG TPA: hypothetical protein QF861_10785 [Alphaproteobacteria bacterium]|nr:hypothetical protein [Alphaproteobacteria bacterium]